MSSGDDQLHLLQHVDIEPRRTRPLAVLGVPGHLLHAVPDDDHRSRSRGTMAMRCLQSARLHRQDGSQSSGSDAPKTPAVARESSRGGVVNRIGKPHELTGNSGGTPPAARRSPVRRLAMGQSDRAAVTLRENGRSR